MLQCSSDFILAGILLLVSQEKLGQVFLGVLQLSGQRRSCFNPALSLRGPVCCVPRLMGRSPFGHILVVNVAALG